MPDDEGQKLVEPALECVNAKLPHDQALLTKTGVDKYYREDNRIVINSIRCVLVAWDHHQIF